MSEELSIRAWVPEEGGPQMGERFMEELREEHLRVSADGRFEADGESVTATLQAVHEEVLAKGADR